MALYRPSQAELEMSKAQAQADCPRSPPRGFQAYAGQPPVAPSYAAPAVPSYASQVQQELALSRAQAQMDSPPRVRGTGSWARPITGAVPPVAAQPVAPLTTTASGPHEWKDDFIPLREYFMFLQVSMRQEWAVPFTFMIELLKDSQKRAAFEAEQKLKISVLNRQLEEVIKKSFARHDANNNRVLDVQESRAFFNTYVTEFERFAIDIERECQCSAKLSEGLRKAERGHTYEGDDAKAAEALWESRDELRHQMAAGISNYKREKEARNQRAFEIVDTKKNGQLELDEVLAALTIDSEQNKRLNQSFGFVSDTITELGIFFAKMD